MTATAERRNAQGFPDDLERLFREHSGLVYRAAYRITGNAQDAEDVLQSLFLRLLRQERPPDLSLNARGYLHRSAVNLALDMIKARKHRTGEIDMAAAAGSDWVVGESIRAAITELNPKAAEIFALRHIEGYSNAEIAAMIGTSPSVIAVTLFRARIQLKRSIRRESGGKREIS